MSCEFRIIDHNYVFDSTVDLIPSSEDAAFPVENLRYFQRARVWRSSGNYKISSTNKYIDFKETGLGATLTATLTEGVYTPDELEAEIKLRMEDVSVDTFTVTYSTSTGKWTIASSGTGFQILFSTGSNAASSCRDVIGFGTNDYTGALTYTGPRIAIHTSESVVIDLKTSDDVDSCVILFDQMAGVKLSSDAIVRIQANATNEWNSPAVSQTMSFDETFGCYSHFFSSAQEFRYWRVYIEDKQNPYLYVELPKVILGKATQLTQVPDVGFEHSIDDLSKTFETPYGHRYADLYPMRRSLSFNYGALSESDLLTLQGIYERFGNTTPICVALDATADLYDKDRFLLYGYMKGNHRQGNRFYSYFDTKLEIEECL